MALPDSFVITPGTPIIWGQPSAAGVTKNMTLDALANNAGRMGVYADLGANFVEEYSVMVVVETGTAPAAGALVEVYFATTDDTSRWPGTVDGTDAAYTIANKFQLGPPITGLYALAAGNTIMRQSPVIWRPSCRYVAPVIINLLGQAFRDETTATDNDSRIILVPRAYNMID